jgi:DNA-binding transcriptional LysR family regulator
MEAQLQDYAEVIRKGQESTLAIAIWPMIDQTLLTKVLHKLNTDYPQTRLHIRYIESMGGQNLLLNEEVDIAVHPGRNAGNEQTFESQTIGQMTLINVIAQSLLDQKPENRSLREQLLHWNRVVMQDNASEKSYGVGIHQGGKQWLVNDQRIISTLIYQGLAWGMLPEPVVQASLANGELVKLDAPEFGSDLRVDVIISRLKNHPCGPVASACWQSFVEKY